MKQMGPASQVATPILLRRIWWLQTFLITTWIFFCGKASRDALWRTDAELQTEFLGEVFLYYNPMLMVAIMLWLWGVNLWVFQNSRVSYAKVFDFDPSHLTHQDIWKVALSLGLAVLTSTTLYMHFYSYGQFRLAAAQPVFLYCAVPLIVALPFDVLYASSRFFFLKTLLRLTFPLQPVTFADFFVADVLTSMAKVLSDMERAICKMYYFQIVTSEESDHICGSGSLWIPCILAFPYACRFFQCLRQYSDTKDKSCLFNALKYATAFPVIIFSALKYHMLWELWFSRYRPLWLVFSFINTCYSYYWDITRDWDFGCLSGNCKTRKTYVLRSNLFYSSKSVYYWAIGSNFVLRCAWTHKLSAHLRDYRLTAFTFSGLEMLRRFQWIFFRVENEFNKMTARSNSMVPLKSIPSDKETLLSFIVTDK